MKVAGGSNCMKLDGNKRRYSDRSPDGKKERSPRRTWYFVRLAFLSIPWKLRRSKNPRGTLFTRYFLIQATNIRGAFRKANHILSLCNHCDGDGRLDGKQVACKKIGILDLEPLYERLQSGAELFDERCGEEQLLKIAQRVITSRQKGRMIRYEEKNGKPPLLDVCWGDGFED